MFTKILSIFACLCLIFLCVFAGPTGLGAFIDPPSFLIVFLLTWFILVSAYGFDNVFKMFGILSNPGVSPERARLYQSMAKCGMLVSLFSGFLGTLIGCIQILSDLSDPDYVGIGLATALLTLFYGALQALVIFVPLYGASKIEVEAREQNEKFYDIGPKNPFRIIALAFMSFVCVGTVAVCILAIFFTQEYEYHPEINNYLETTMEPMKFSLPNAEGKNLVLGITLHTNSHQVSSLVEDPKSGAMSILRPIQAKIIEIVYSKFPQGIELTQENQQDLAKELKLSFNSLKSELTPEIPGQVLEVHFYSFHFE